MSGHAPSRTPAPSIGAFDAKTHLSRLLEDVRGGAVVTITVRGVPVAKLVPAGAEVRLPARPDLNSWLVRVREMRSKSGKGAESAPALVRAGRRQ
jgi:prevent-host-death family protein